MTDTKAKPVTGKDGWVYIKLETQQGAFTASVPAADVESALAASRSTAAPGPRPVLITHPGCTAEPMAPEMCARFGGWLGCPNEAKCATSIGHVFSVRICPCLDWRCLLCGGEVER